MRARVFITQPVAESAIARLRAVADVIVNTDSSRVPDKAVLIDGVKNADILFALLHDTIDRDILMANPALRAVASMTITPDRIDVAEATRRGIVVTNIPAVVTDATADLTFGLLLAVARRLVEGDKLLRAGVYPGSQSNHLTGVAVSGKTLGIIGCGRIGQAVSRRAHGFGMRVLYYDVQRLSESDEHKFGVTYAPQAQVFGEADFVVLHAQLTDTTRHLVGERELNQMKPTAFLVNTSRGPVVDEAALIKALRDKTIAGAGLDVYEHEPEVSPELLAMQNVVLSPHLGSAVFELRETMAHVVADNIVAIIEGRTPPNCINPETLAQARRAV